MRVSDWDGLLLVHDPDDPANVRPETVLGINNTTRTLACLTPRAPVGRALDVGTGSGGLALRLAQHAETVVATDLSERAIRYARINAAMAGVELDCRVGDLFEPVRGDGPFDLVTANLPFVVSPDSAFTFRDGGHGADAVSRVAVREAAANLAEGGMAVLLCSWIVHEGESWDASLRAWVRGIGCDCIAIHHMTDEPEPYARRWNEFLLVQDPPSYNRAVERWLAAYREWGVSGIATGAFALRRRSGDHWFQPLQMEVAPRGDGGQQLQRIFAGRDAASSEDVLDLVCTLVPHQLEQTMAYDGGWSAEPGRVVLRDCAGIVGSVDPLAIHVLLRLDGTTSVRELCAAVAADTGLDEAALTTAAEATMRRLVGAGCVEIA